MPGEVAFNQSLRGENYYGYGIITATPMNNLDNIPELEMQKGGKPCDKQEVLYGLHEKVARNAPNNYKMIVEEPSMKMNYNQRQEEDLDRGVAFVEAVENQNLDFDNDGELDIDLGDTRMVNNEKADEVNELIRQLAEDTPALAEASTKTNEPEKVIKEEHKKIVNQKASGIELASEQDHPKPYEKAKNELKSVEANLSNKNRFSMGDGVVAGAGAMALALMIMGRV